MTYTITITTMGVLKVFGVVAGIAALLAIGAFVEECMVAPRWPG